MLKAKLSIGFFLIYSTCLFSQSIYLEDIDDYLVMPNDLNLSFQEQSDFYIKKYNTFLDYFQKELNEYQAEIKRLKDKKKLSKKNKKYLQDLEGDISYWEAKIDTIGIYLTTWELFEEPNLSIDLAEGLKGGGCFEIYNPQEIKTSRIVALEDYAVALVDYSNTNKIEWEERLPCRIGPKSKVVRKKWIKRRADKNCLSTDPDDCLVWCYIEETEEVENKTCPKDFKLNENACECIRRQYTEIQLSKVNRFKLIERETWMEIKVVDFKKKDCN